MKLLLTVVLSICVCKSVYGAKCSDKTSSSCEVTDFTLATCKSDTKVCACKDGYAPIPSGCGKKFSKPTVTLPVGRTSKLINSKSGDLTCTTSETLPITGVAYAWYKDGTKIDGETAKSYTVNEAGGFSCEVVPSDATLSTLTSEKSDAMTITVLADGASDSDTPAIVASTVPAKAADGVTLAIKCGNIPIGADVKFMDENDQDVPTIETASATFTKIKCQVQTTAGVTFDTPTSEPVDMPTLATDIASATLQIDVGTATPYVFNKDARVTATCVTDPQAQFMADQFAYTFKVNGTQGSSTDNPGYTIVTSMAETQQIMCEAAYNSNTAKTSENVMVQISEDYIAKPTITASGTKLLDNSRLVLMCHADADAHVMWMKDDVVIFRQSDHTLQIDPFVAAAAGSYKCRATKDSFSLDSDATIIQRETALEKPVIESTVSPTSFYGKGGDYNLTCRTASNTVGMTYSWKRNNNNLDETTHLYKIEDADDSDSGNYTCSVAFDSKTSESDPHEVLIEAAGKKCTQDSDCTGDAYKEKCTEERCECADDFVKKGTMCQDHACALMSSVVLILAMAVISKIF